MSFRKHNLKAEDLNLKQVISLLEYRRPKKVLLDGYRCPRCHAHTNTDYQKYCSECGQKLDWSHTYYETDFLINFDYLFHYYADELYIKEGYIRFLYKIYEASPKVKKLLKNSIAGVFRYYKNQYIDCIDLTTAQLDRINKKLIKK